MGTDIFYRKCFIHIILADIVFNEKNGWIFLRGIFCFGKIFFRLIDQRLMKFRKCETVINCFCNAFNISRTCNLLLIACIFQT